MRALLTIARRSRGRRPLEAPRAGLQPSTAARANNPSARAGSGSQLSPRSPERTAFRRRGPRRPRPPRARERVGHRLEQLGDAPPGAVSLPPVEGSSRPPAAVRLARAFGGRDIPALGLLGIDRERPHIAVLAARVGRLPGTPAVAAPRRSAAACLVGASRRARGLGRRRSGLRRNRTEPVVSQPRRRRAL